MPRAHAAEAGHRDAQRARRVGGSRGAHSVTIRFSRQDVVAASASASAATPSWIVVAIGLFMATWRKRRRHAIAMLRKGSAA